ncbi:uncharacterized protein E0L32_003206 [Thyridium curvatum]|uniref:Disease resistance R13L4/SHOC-2-like LRR domain-containing protein n=1 Tax=Thyridium curvatum TaxID=1093900 RepID=A0A507BK52_9PEZI|nr:uncharacterized protein E0L32_003206 [Thyridium curvatum]TPX17088.1 hypothetical protein E0L32_003206 [Thyridium curvatum]
MDRLDRPSALPLGGRGLPENPAQGRRVAAAAAANIPPPPVPPMPNLRDVPSVSVLSASAPLSASQVLALAKEAMADARRENRSQAAEASGVSNELKPGLTIDLSRKNIQKLPDEVVDVIKGELERLALSHNKLTSFPTKFSECLSLRYLNVRNNDIKEFPLPLCDLKSLEILDLGRNKLKVLPPQIVKLTSLKVFAVQKNRIEELPLCLAEMGSLQVLKLDGNPIKFPPPEVFQVQATSPPNEGYLEKNEVAEVAVTSHIKKFLRQRTQNERTESDAGGDESSEGTETPRQPMKRVVSGRFPIKVNGTDLPDLRSPSLSRPPPIPTRSHYRGLSQQNTAVRRPGVMPLTISNANERLRSNSETLLQPSRAERAGDRSRRMGIVSKKAQELGTLDEVEASNRFSHYRGLSHGSAMQGSVVPVGAKSPNSPGDSLVTRPVYVRRLSVLPERKRESKFFDPVLEAAKGILYSIFQIHPSIQMLMGLTNDGSTRRSSLEIVFYNTTSHVEELEREIQRHDPSVVDPENHGSRDNENVHRACVTLVNAYAHVCSLLASNVDHFIDNGDPRYIRTLLLQLYNSIMELRVTVSQLTPDESTQRRVNKSAIGRTLKPHSRESSVTPTADRPLLNQRVARSNFIHNPSNLRVATDVPAPYVNGMNGGSRTATIVSATPRSGESFVSSGSRGPTGDFTEEDRMFDRIFLSLQKTSDLVMRILPNFNHQFTLALRSATAQRAPDRVIYSWRVLISKCSTAIQQCEELKNRLSMIKLKEPGLRTQGAFWTLCNNFIHSWAELACNVREYMNKIQLPIDTRTRLRPVQQCMRELVDLILQSPWSYFIKQGALYAGVTSPLSQQVQLPMTPQSAALGPAVQATVPSTPQSASFSQAFSGNVFERADALISMGGISMSRGGTLSSTSASSSFNSISTLPSNSDGVMTPSSTISPGPPGGMSFSGYRQGNGSKDAF